MRQHAVLATALVCASWVAAGSAVGTQYYVSSSGGSDDNAGTSPSAAWATITKLTDFGWDPGFRPGDTIFLDGTFTDYLWIQLDKSFGSDEFPLHITSLDPTNPATISVSGTDGIFIYTFGVVPGGGGVIVDHLIIKGDGSLITKNGQTAAGVFIYHDAPGDVGNFVFDSLDVSGFSSSGMETFRYNQSGATGWITNVTITNSVFHENPGYPNWPHPSGSGIVLAGVKGGLIQNTTAYKNGALNSSPGGGPVGIWTYDADSIVIRNCTSHDNLSLKNDGGGFDLDGGTTNSLIDNVLSYNNYGPGLYACSFGDYNGSIMNNYGWNENNTIRNSKSLGDGYGRKFSSLSVFPTQVPLTNLLFENIVVTIDDTPCAVWGSDYSEHYAIWIDSNADSGNDPTTATFNNITITCAGATKSVSLACNSKNSGPECVAA